MFTPQRVERTETWIEYHVPVPWGTGTPWKNLHDALSVVNDRYFTDYRKNPVDDSITVLVGDDEIILRYAQPKDIS